MVYRDELGPGHPHPEHYDERPEGCDCKHGMNITGWQRAKEEKNKS